MLAAPRRSIPRRLSKPSDWGFGVTVCIASASHPQRAIVAVADSMITVGHGEITADDAAMKHHVIHQDWFGMFAGDVGPACPVLRRAARMLESADTHTIDTVRSAVTSAYEQERMAQAQNAVLGVYGLSMSAKNQAWRAKV